VESTLKKKDGFSLEGELESELIFYDNIIGLGAELHFNPSKSELEVSITENSVLKEDQVNGVDEDRIVAMMKSIHHHGDSKAMVFAEPFSERLALQLQNIKKE
jgi:hypothetical protein